MNRRGLKFVRRVGLFLLLGAIVNVAVAWGIALTVDYGNSPRQGSTEDWCVSRWDGFGSSRLDSIRIRRNEALYPGDPEAVIPFSFPLAAPSRAYLDGHVDFEQQLIEARGWPMLSLFCKPEPWLQMPGQSQRSTAVRRRLDTGIRLSNGSGQFGTIKLPMRPMWIGFIVNSALYANLSLADFRARRDCATSDSSSTQSLPGLRLPHRHQPSLHRVRRGCESASHDKNPDNVISARWLSRCC